MYMAKAVKQKAPAIRLLGDRILVRSFDKAAEAKTASGLIIPGKEGSEKQERGEVIAVGPGRLQDGKRVSPEVKKGDTVIFKRDYTADEITLNGEEYTLLSESSVLAIEA